MPWEEWKWCQITVSDYLIQNDLWQDSGEHGKHTFFACCLRASELNQGEPEAQGLITRGDHGLRWTTPRNHRQAAAPR